MAWRHRNSPAHQFKNAGPGFVYVLAAGGGWYKIGHTRHVPSRYSTLQMEFEDRPIEFLFAIHSEHRQRLEYDLHVRFAAVHQTREFFALTVEQLTDLRAMASHFDMDECIETSPSMSRHAVARRLLDEQRVLGIAPQRVDPFKALPWLRTDDEE